MAGRARNADIVPPRRVYARLAVAVAVVVVAAWALGLFLFVSGMPDTEPDDTRVTDAIVVLTGGSGRVGQGLDLLSRGRARKLFVSGVYKGVEVSELLRISRQSPEELACCVNLGYEAASTHGNAIETARWMREHGYTSLRLVTAAYHMPRSLLELRNALPPDAEIVPHPVFPEHVKQKNWWQWPGSTHLLVGEYNKYLAALVRIAFTRMFGG